MLSKKAKTGRKKKALCWGSRELGPTADAGEDWPLGGVNIVNWEEWKEKGLSDSSRLILFYRQQNHEITVTAITTIIFHDVRQVWKCDSYCSQLLEKKKSQGSREKLNRWVDGRRTSSKLTAAPQDSIKKNKKASSQLGKDSWTTQVWWKLGPESIKNS